MRKTISLILVLVFVFGLSADVAKAKLVACVGDSVTYGFGLTNRASNSYPAQLATILQSFDGEWETQNFGVSGATLLRNTNKPYVVQNAYHSALTSEPDVVVIQLGGNDTARATISQIEQNYISDYLALIDAFAQLPSQPRIIVCKPPPVFGGSYGSNATLKNVINPLIEHLPTYREVEIIDMHTPMEDFGRLFPDYLHPNAEGARMLAEIVASVILGFRFSPDFNQDYAIDIEDLIMLIEHWHKDEASFDIAPPPSGDGIVDRTDLEALMARWGQDDPTLTAHWALNESEGTVAYDSAAENDAIVIGDALWLPDGGQIGGAVQLDGVDDYINAPPVLNPKEGVFSVFVWIKEGAPGQVVLSQADASNWVGADPVEGKLMTNLTEPEGRFSQPTPPLVSEVVVTDGNWHEVGVVWDGSDRILYVDDIEVARDTLSGGMKGAESGLYMGVARDLAEGTFWSGLIDDVRIYDRVVEP